MPIDDVTEMQDIPGGSGAATVSGKRSREEAGLDAGGDKLLIPYGEGENQIYMTRAEYNQKSARPYDDALDKAPVLIKEQEFGNYVTKAQAHSLIKVPDEIAGEYPGDGTQAEKDAYREKRTAYKDKVFAEQMGELGLTTDKHNETKLELNWERSFDTPDGKRYSNQNYVDPVAAGEHSPEMLVKTDEGYRAAWPKKEDVKNLDDAISKFGDENILLRDKRGGYKTVESIEAAREKYDRTHPTSKPAKSAKDIVDNIIDNKPDRTSSDMPKVLLEGKSGTFVSKDIVESQRGGPLTADDMKRRNVLVQKLNGQGYVTPNTFVRTQGKNADAQLESMGVPADMPKKSFRNPNLLVNAGNGVFYSGSAAVKELEGTPIEQAYKPEDILVQTTGKNKKITGNFTTLKTMQHYQGEDKANAYLHQMQPGSEGRTPEAQKMAEMAQNEFREGST